ncbi:HAMP domain-containing sensor histidine kinase [Corynebacterium sp.]|uniref:sensor histidine kinase n=1 Tax=Corynebacterium sp. TaxID=1720 RepID=UPI002648E046|nr:HAMP domain-containing sensor histidine kinase [Corynebacterium sp.]MDN6136227.1 HAMP domain-containing histidine kinase [Corynebacterium sp.]MDN6737794.1 HAMP domain-containing histidine kinase [Corynebacterium sp.]
MPLRTWLVVLLVVVSGLGIISASVAVSAVMRDVLYNQVDDELIAAQNGWARTTNVFGLDLTGRPPTEYSLIKIYPDGAVRYLNPYESMPQVDELVIGAAPETVDSTSESNSTSEWRAMATERDGVITVVAKNLDSEQILLRGLALVQLMIAVVVLMLIAIAGFWFIRRALRPLRVVEKTASEIAAGDLDKRVPEWPQHTEVGQLASALNIMLAKLQASVEQAQGKEEQMRRFVGDASHELRTPLTSLRGYTELYRAGITDDVDMVLSKIDAESSRMSYLVEDLLALTRAEGTRLDIRPVDVLELSLSVASSARAAFTGRSINVANNTSGVPVVYGDASRLHQIILNLITNGLRHGGEEAEITIGLEKDNGDVLIKVIDTGRGMDPEVSSHIFERFYREDTSRTRDTGGSGLGLAIVKSLVEQHGGSISVESELGVGSTFTVRLPAAEEPESMEASEDLDEVEAPQANATPVKAAPKNRAFRNGKKDSAKNGNGKKNSTKPENADKDNGYTEEDEH